MPRPSRTRRTIVALLSLVVALLAAEGVARLVFDPPAVNSNLVADPLLGYRMPRNIDWELQDERGSFRYRLNSEGFPGPELPPEGASPTGERILLVGDSFLNTWKIREEEWVGSVLRDELRASGHESEVFAISCDDYGTAQQLLLLRRYGRRVAPTTVVLLVFPNNDVINDSLALAGRTQVSAGDYFRPYLVDEGGPEPSIRYAQPWKARMRRSRLFSVIESLWLRRFGTASEWREQLSGVVDLGPEERVQAGQLPDESLEVFRAPAPGGAWARAWKEAETPLLAFRREVEELGARFVVVTIPSVHQVKALPMTKAYDQMLDRAGRPTLDEQLDWEWPEKHFEAFCHGNGIAHVQLLQSVRDAVAMDSPLYRRDGHFDGRGHTLMGRRLAARLLPGAEDQCFVPRPGTRPVALSRLYPDPAFELDLTERPCAELIEDGWGNWVPSGSTAGWPLKARQGTFLAPNRKGKLSLRCLLLPGIEFPATIVISLDGLRTLAEHIAAAPGEFVLTLPMWHRGASDDWLPLALSIAGPDQTHSGALVLTGMHFRP